MQHAWRFVMAPPVGLFIVALSRCGCLGATLDASTSVNGSSRNRAEATLLQDLQDRHHLMRSEPAKAAPQLPAANDPEPDENIRTWLTNCEDRSDSCVADKAADDDFCKHDGNWHTCLLTCGGCVPGQTGSCTAPRMKDVHPGTSNTEPDAEFVACLEGSTIYPFHYCTPKCRAGYQAWVDTRQHTANWGCIDVLGSSNGVWGSKLCCSHGHFSPTMFYCFQDLFLTLDADGSGAVSREEFESLEPGNASADEVATKEDAEMVLESQKNAASKFDAGAKEVRMVTKFLIVVTVVIVIAAAIAAYLAYVGQDQKSVQDYEEDDSVGLGHNPPDIRPPGAGLGWAPPVEQKEHKKNPMAPIGYNMEGDPIYGGDYAK